MSLFKAIGKLFCRNANDKILEHDTKKAKHEAYIETGIEIKNAKSHGYRINGSKTYQKKKNEKVNKAKAKHRNRDKFIDDY